MAEQLVETMASAWNPKKYRDEYHQDLLRMIDKKIKSGQTKVTEPAETARRPPKDGKVVDIMHLLRRSMEQVQKRNEPPRSRKAS
jgi:DNA end-binding protein Ku